MLWVIGFLALAVVVFGVLVATGRLGGMAPEPIRDVYQPVLPTGSLTADDLHGLKLGVSAQGYAMSQVDDLLDRLAGEIDERDRIIEDLLPRREKLPSDEAPAETITTDSRLDLTPDNGSAAVTDPEQDTIGNNGGVR